ncbi:MAG: transcription termination/antitermination protein NusG, partial [bacterium]
MTDNTQDSASAVSTPSGNKRWYVVHAYSGMEK